jgi:hypothetical protein
MNESPSETQQQPPGVRADHTNDCGAVEPVRSFIDRYPVGDEDFVLGLMEAVAAPDLCVRSLAGLGNADHQIFS